MHMCCAGVIFGSPLNALTLGKCRWQHVRPLW